MKELFQSVVMRLALCGLAASLAAVVIRSRVARVVGERLLSVWRSLTAFGRVALCSFLLAGILVGGDKTNGVFETGFTRLTGLSWVGNPVNPVQTRSAPAASAQRRFAVRKAANWKVRGAWKDSFWLPFEDGWVFPWGTNHLDGVEVISQGETWATPFGDAVASLGVPVEIARGLTTFGYEFTPSNTYRFVWTDAAINRDTNNLVFAALELFRNGNVSVTTNGVAVYLQRVLPFAHNGFGQDDEWVTANFTNATEILAVGYPRWVDAQIGTGLTNGLYKLTVSVADDPPETTQISVGEYSIAVTNAGEYVFLLGKCIDYPISVFPDTATNFTYAAVDDIAPQQTLRGMAGVNDGRWTTDEGELELVVPYGVVFPVVHAAHVRWRSKLCVTPANWQPSAFSSTETFSAVVSEIPWWIVPSYRWNTSDPDVVSISTPNSPVTQMTCHYPAADVTRASLSLEVSAGDCSLRSYYVYDPEGEDGSQGVNLTMSAPDVLFVNDDDDDGQNGIDALSPFAGDDDIIEGSILFHSPIPTNGTIEVEGIYGYDEGFGERPLLYSDMSCTDSIEAGHTYHLLRTTEWSQSLYFNPATVSTSHPGVQVKVRWRPESGSEVTASKRLTIASPVVEPVCKATTNVVEEGVEHTYTVNPSGVAVGREAYFRVDVAPASFPDSEIVWVKSPGLDFVGPGKGRSVTVRGVSAGDATLSVKVGDCLSSVPKFRVHVVENATVDMRVWIIENGPLHSRPIQPDAVRQMVKDVNDIYAQVGVTLNLVEPIVVTNIPAAYDVFYSTPSNSTDVWTYWDVVDLHSDTQGLECYFVNSFSDSADTLAANSSWGLIATREADAITLAHEIGHAFGMHDIYVDNNQARSAGEPRMSLRSSDYASADRMPIDWNGGCCGEGASGARYYRAGTRMSDIVPRMLMHGVHAKSASHTDITSGFVYGVHYTNTTGSVRFWDKGNVPVGFPWNDRNPKHK